MYPDNLEELQDAVDGLYIIWSYEHKAWWRPKGCGYVKVLGGAGLYSKKEAERICYNANAHGERNERMIPAHEVLTDLLGGDWVNVLKIVSRDG